MKLILAICMSAITAVGQTTQAPSKAVVPTPELQSGTSRIVKLSDEEYARLQKLRQAVVDAEKEIAKAHGVYIQPIDPHPTWVGCYDTCPTPKPTDHYQFAGQFLLVNLPGRSR